jgi:LysR family transcriptional regulator, regulator for genes of the gallate degradation pathway
MDPIKPRVFPSLRQLRAFEATARLQSVSGAAREINLSQPGLSQAIRSLEHRLNSRLFERRKSGCYPTELGTVLQPRVERFFSRLRSALRDDDSQREGTDAIVHRMTKPQIRSVIAISEHESFYAAARSLRVSQPSLHRSARELERNLRRSLYQRTAHGITTTPYGYELARRFQVALREIEYAVEELQAVQGKFVSQIAIGNIPHSATQVLSNAIQDFLSRYPTARVQIVDGHYEDLLRALRAGRIDVVFGVLRRPDWATDVKDERLFANPYVIIGRTGHPLSGLPRIRPRDLIACDWIMPGPMTPRQQALHKILESVSASPKVSIETTSMQIYRTILATTDRLTLMSRCEAQLNDDRTLAVLPFHSPHLRRFDGIATRADWQPPSVHLEFVDLLRAAARRIEAQTRAPKLHAA